VCVLKKHLIRQAIYFESIGILMKSSEQIKIPNSYVLLLDENPNDCSESPNEKYWEIIQPHTQKLRRLKCISVSNYYLTMLAV
jgi:hypothetical protein